MEIDFTISAKGDLLRKKRRIKNFYLNKKVLLFGINH